MTSRIKSSEEVVFAKFIEIEEDLDLPRPLLQEVIELALNDSNFIKKLKRFTTFSKNLSEIEIRHLQGKNIAFNKQEELVFLNDLLELSKQNNYFVKSFYLPRELQGQENKLLLKILKEIGYEKDSSGILRFSEKISKFSKYLR